jgi:hypothetical protein
VTGAAEVAELGRVVRELLERVTTQRWAFVSNPDRDHLADRFRLAPSPWGRTSSIVLGVLTLAAVLNGIVYGVALGGAGHGWGVPGAASFYSAPLAPLSCVAWVQRDRRQGRALAMTVLVLQVAADAFVVGLADGRIVNSAACKEWQVAPEAILFWLVCWLFPQAVAVAALVSASCIVPIEVVPSEVLASRRQHVPRTLPCGACPPACPFRAARRPVTRLPGLPLVERSSPGQGTRSGDVWT